MTHALSVRHTARRFPGRQASGTVELPAQCCVRLCYQPTPLLEFQRTQKYRKRFITGVKGKITHAQAATSSK